MARLLLAARPWKKLWVDLPPVHGTASRFLCDQLKPAGADQAIEQAACLLGIKPAAKSILPDVL